MAPVPSLGDPAMEESSATGNTIPSTRLGVTHVRRRRRIERVAPLHVRRLLSRNDRRRLRPTVALRRRRFISFRRSFLRSRSCITSSDIPGPIFARTRHGRQRRHGVFNCDRPSGPIPQIGESHRPVRIRRDRESRCRRTAARRPAAARSFGVAPFIRGVLSFPLSSPDGREVPRASPRNSSRRRA